MGGSKPAAHDNSNERRAMPPPRIFVCTSPEPYYAHDFSRAHIRNKSGYVYLAWREGKRVRNFYLGKAPRSSPTTGAGAGDEATDPGAPLGRGKLRGSR